MATQLGKESDPALQIHHMDASQLFFHGESEPELQLHHLDESRLEIPDPEDDDENDYGEDDFESQMGDSRMDDSRVVVMDAPAAAESQQDMMDDAVDAGKKKKGKYMSLRSSPNHFMTQIREFGLYRVFFITLTALLFLFTILYIFFRTSEIRASRERVDNSPPEFKSPPLSSETEGGQEIAAQLEEPIAGPMEVAKNELVTRGISTKEVLDDPKTPQSMALTWIVHNDTLQIELTPSDTSLWLQRYTLATIFYSMNGPSWYNNTNWLSSKSECEWMGVSCELHEFNKHAADTRGTSGGGERRRWLVERRVQTVAGENVAGENVAGDDGTNATHDSAEEKTGEEEVEEKGGSAEDNEKEGSEEEGEEMKGAENREAENVNDTGANAETRGEEAEGEEDGEDENGENGTEEATITDEEDGAEEKKVSSRDEEESEGTEDENETSAQEGQEEESKEGKEVAESNKTSVESATLLNAEMERANIGYEQVTGLDLTSNYLVGTIPPEIVSLDKLQRLMLGDNKISGVLPMPESDSDGNWTDLKDLFLGSNLLEGSLPAQISNLTSLVRIDLSNNRLSSAIPSDIESLLHLEYLSLNNNSFESSIPPALGFLTELRSLLLHNNTLTGPIPAALGNLDKLVELTIDFNEGLIGDVPNEICELGMEGFGENFPSSLPTATCGCCDGANFNNRDSMVDETGGNATEAP